MNGEESIFNQIFYGIKPLLKDVYQFDNYTCRHSLQVAKLVYDVGNDVFI